MTVVIQFCKLYRNHHGTSSASVFRAMKTHPLKVVHSKVFSHRPWRLRLAPVAASALLVLPSLLHAQSTWVGTEGDGGNGAWNVADHWSNSLPDTNNAAQFYLDAVLTAPSAVIDLPSGTVTPRALTVGAGKSVTLNLGTGVRLEAKQAISAIGTNLGTGSGAANLTIAGPETGTATVQLASFYVGHNGGNGNTLTFTGGVTVTDAGTSFSMVGHGGGTGDSSHYNLLRVEEGASLTRFALYLARGTNSVFGNRVEVDNATLAINGGSAAATSTGFLIGNAANSSQNALAITNGGVVTVTTGVGGSTTNRLELGAQSGARSNTISVEGTGSLLQLLQGTTLTVGHSNSYGGNSVTVANGGTINATGAVTIAGYALNGGNNDGYNRLVIANGGTFTTETTITNHGLVQLASGGVLNGTGSLGIENGARFEVAGSGLAIQATVKAGGVLAVGLNPLEESQWILSTSVVMQSGAILELNLFDDGKADRIVFDSGGILDLTAGGVTLKLLADDTVLTDGATWSLFTGNGFSGSFDIITLPELTDGLVWDLSNFNEAGSWQVAVIPEPGSSLLICAGLGAVMAFKRRRSSTV